LLFRRNDIVRFRKRSQIAKGLGVNLDTLYTVEMDTTYEGRPRRRRKQEIGVAERSRETREHRLCYK
jgi:hypothetical protein